MITLITISDSDKHFGTAIAEYLKRLGRTITIRTLAPHKWDHVPTIVAKETQQLIVTVSRMEWHKILLSRQGQTRDTATRWQQLVWHDHIVYMIGGPYGLDEELLRPYYDVALSLGGMTMPHGLAKLVVLEQIYRLQQIAAHKPYHY